MTIAERVMKILTNDYGTGRKKIDPETPLEDLGLDSLDIVELGMDVEDEFNIDIPDCEQGKFKSFNDVVKAIERIIKK